MAWNYGYFNPYTGRNSSVNELKALKDSYDTQKIMDGKDFSEEDKLMRQLREAEEYDLEELLAEQDESLENDYSLEER